MMKITKSIEVFFLESLLKISLFSIIVVMVVDYSFNRFDVSRSVIVNCAVLFAIITTYILHRKGFFRAAVLWIGFIIMAAMFYQSITAPAITTSSMAVVMVIGFGFSVLLSGKLPLILHGITFMGMTLVFGWLALHPEQYGETGPGNIVVAGVTYEVLYSVVAYSSRLLKQRYDEVFEILAIKNSELAENAHEIAAQNEELQQNQDNLFQLNNHLERLVEERTNVVKQQNERLVRYAYSNAHHVRGPVARLLGLVQLSKMDTDLSYEFLFSRMEEQALEIDTVIKGINQELEPGN
jgi:signal transduction histidine kinase